MKLTKEMEKDPIIWQVNVNGVGRIHTLPNKAVVTVRGLNGIFSIWIDDKGIVHVNEGYGYSYSDKENL